MVKILLIIQPLVRITLEDLKPAKGSTHGTKRVGRGRSSGWGKTSCRGHNGEGQRSGRSSKRGFEGGQMPIYRRLPKRGFNNINHNEYAIVNIASLNKFKEGTVVTPALLVESGLVRKEFDGVKILGNGELTVKLTVQANKFSKSAVEAIEKAGGKAEVI